MNGSLRIVENGPSSGQLERLCLSTMAQSSSPSKKGRLSSLASLASGASHCWGFVRRLQGECAGHILRRIDVNVFTSSVFLFRSFGAT